MSRIREWVIGNALLLVAIYASLMTIGFAVQTIRIDGLQVDLPFVGSIGPAGLKAELEAAEKTISDVERAEELARKEAVAARDSEALALKELKEIADEARDQIERSNLERARAFAARGGVRPEAYRGQPGAPVAPTPSGGAEGGDGAGEVPEMDDLRAEDLVTITFSDLEICTINTSRLLAAQPWGLELEARNTEPVAP